MTVVLLFTCNSQLELPLPKPCNSVESDTGCTSRIYFDIVTLTLHNVTPTSQKPCKYNNKLDCSEKNPQYAINEVFFYKILLSDILLKKNINITSFILLTAE